MAFIFYFSCSSSSASILISSLYFYFSSFFSFSSFFFLISYIYFSFLFSRGFVHTIVYLKLTIGSDTFRGTLQYIFYKSTKHFSRCTYPQVLKTMLPLPSIKTSTLGSDLFSFLRPANILGLSSISGVLTLTLRMDLVWEPRGMKDMQLGDVEMVPDL